MQTAKKACLSVNAKLDYRLLARLDAAIKRLQSEQGAKRQKIKRRPYQTSPAGTCGIYVCDWLMSPAMRVVDNHKLDYWKGVQRH